MAAQGLHQDSLRGCNVGFVEGGEQATATHERIMLLAGLDESLRVLIVGWKP